MVITYRLVPQDMFDIVTLGAALQKYAEMFPSVPEKDYLLVVAPELKFKCREYLGNPNNKLYAVGLNINVLSAMKWIVFHGPVPYNYWAITNHWSIADSC